MNAIGQCYTPTSLWRALREKGRGKHTVLVEMNSAQDILYVKVR